ncbi:SMI1/KNR4 family protein [Nonomuraea sp. NPDC049784]|uniref:SMI1/KNR4 family protein n=1 Tax=Nonomuraea sp. NPDC049784 TaxID=3154361 RepID=UPI00340F7678
MLVLLASGTQALESAVFSKEPVAVTAGEVVITQGRPLQDGACDEVPSESSATCLFLDIQSDDDSPASMSTPAQEPAASAAETPDEDCRPKDAAPTVRTLNAKVARAVNRQWRRIESWLKANAPRSYRTLGKPGKVADIAAAEAEMGLRFPDDLRASLLRHDGSIYLKDTWAFGFLGNTSASVSEIRDTWRGLCEIDHEDVGDPGYSDPRTEWWDGRMLAVGADGMGDHLVIDSVKRDVGDTDHEGSNAWRDPDPFVLCPAEGHRRRHGERQIHRLLEAQGS